SSSSRTPFGSDAFNRTPGDVGRADGAGGRAIGAAATTGTKASGALFGITVNSVNSFSVVCRRRRSATQLRN
ncbi:MAG: hypothetical protein QHC90_19670, partial [Shinella sp.]|nr:hypothetical protein [Shinella sp.]